MKTTPNEKEHKSKANDVDKLVSQRLRTRRIMLGLSQQDVANAADVTVQQIQKYEKSINRISSGKLFNIAKFLKVSVGYFYGQDEGSKKSVNFAFAEDQAEYDADKQGAVKEREVISLIRAFCEVKSPQGRKKIIELVKAMI